MTQRPIPVWMRRIRKRDGLCYELTDRVMFEEPVAEHWYLCHGTVHPRQNPLWSYLDRGRGRRVFEEHVRYSMVEAARASLAAGHHWGPWHDDAWPSAKWYERHCR